MSSALLSSRLAVLKFSPTWTAITVGVLVLLYLLRQWALPKPLPGIPYNKEAANRILGDSYEIQGIKKAGGRVRTWFSKQTAKHNSAIVQTFLAPGSKPAIIISDFREAQDILLRRGKEFDRGGRNVQGFKLSLPFHSIGMTSRDPHFKSNRELVKDLMTPHFLNDVSAPEIYRNTLKLVDLWKLKAQIATGRPFDADNDFRTLVFDMIKDVALGDGMNGSGLDNYSEIVKDSHRSSNKEQVYGHPDEIYPFPYNELSVDIKTHSCLTDAVGRAVIQPIPALFNFIWALTPAMREAHRNKQRLLSTQVAFAMKRIEDEEKAIASGGSAQNTGVRSALDYMLRREIAAAKKAGRAPVCDSPYMYDELYGYIGAGNDTTGATLQWAFKFLIKHPDAQSKLRAALHAAFPEALAEERQPEVTEITDKAGHHLIPYLDAFLEEAARLNGPIPALQREATCDTVILGHPIPKGTLVYVDTTGPSMHAPSIKVDESLRSESSQRHANDIKASWDDFAPSEFHPERWLVPSTDAPGTVVFDPRAGPFLSFSAGTRGCFGRRLAYLEMRVIVTLLVWNFDFLPLPEDERGLNDWSVYEGMTVRPKKFFVRLANLTN